MRAGWRPLRVGLQLAAGAGVTVILLAAAEFLGGRLLAAKGLAGGDDFDLVGPIDVLGKRFLMVEQTHPNERGHAIIAEAIAQELERLPAFARVAQVPVPGSAAGR
jgi:hypothetical protein